jgi:predicted MFS family arabinose efflux permease
VNTALARRVGVAAAGFATFINLYCTQAILPELAHAFHAPLPRTGLSITAPLLAVAFVAPFVGSVSDRLGRKRLITLAAAALVLPTALIAGAESLRALVVWRFVQGLLFPFIFAITIAYIGDESDEADAVRLAGVYSLGTIVGGFCGRFIEGYAAEFVGWRAGFLLLAAITGLAAALIAALLPVERRFTPQRGLARALAGFAEHLANRRLLATYAAGFAVLFSIVASFTYANFLLAAPPYRLGPAALSNVFSVYLLAVVATPAATRMAVRLGRRATLAAAAGCAIAGLALTLLPSLVAIITGLALAIAGLFIEQVLALGFIGIAAVRAKSTAVGLYVTAYYIGGSLGGVLPGGLWRSAGWAGCVALVILVQLAMLAIVLIFWGKGPAPTRPQE